MTTAKKPRKRPARIAPPKVQLVATSHRRKIKIQDWTTSIVIMIPGYSWEAVALAHAIAAQLLIEAGDPCWPWIIAPRIDPGDRLLTCTLVRVDFNLVGLDELGRRMVVMMSHAIIAAKKVAQPVGAREPTHDVVVDVTSKET